MTRSTRSEWDLEETLDEKQDEKLDKIYKTWTRIFLDENLDENQSSSQSQGGSRVVGPTSIYRKAKLAKRKRVYLAIQDFLPQQA